MRGAAFGYTRQRGYHPILASRADTGEVLHARARPTPRGALRFVEELIARVERAGASGPQLLRADSGFWSKTIFARLTKAGWSYSIGVRLQPPVRAAIEQIPEHAWQTLEDYPPTSEAQLAETMLGDQRLIVRRVRPLDAQGELLPSWEGSRIWELRKAWARRPEGRLGAGGPPSRPCEAREGTASPPSMSPDPRGGLSALQHGNTRPWGWGGGQSCPERLTAAPASHATGWGGARRSPRPMRTRSSRGEGFHGFGTLVLGVRLLERRVARVVVSNPKKTRAIAEAKVKADKVDAEILAGLLAADYLPARATL